jgi:hypothetical protein
VPGLGFVGISGAAVAAEKAPAGRESKSRKRNFPIKFMRMED